MADKTFSESLFAEIDSSAEFGWTPFLTCVRRGDVSTVQKLIADGHSSNERNIFGLSALTVSVVSKSECMVETILNAPDFNYDLKAGELIDPVSLACLLGLQNIVLVLLDKLPQLVNNVVPFSGFTPIFFAAINRHHKIVKILAEKGANLRARNAAQQTLMDVANMMSDAELVQFLMANSGNSDFRKPRCHPRLFTPPRCLNVNGVSPVSPKIANSSGKTPRSLTFKVPYSPQSTPKAAKSPRSINNNFLPDITFDLSNDFSSNSSQFDTSSEIYTYSLTAETFTPIAQSSLAFTRSTPSKNFSPHPNNSGCFTPKLISYSRLAPSPYSGLNYSSGRNMPSPNGSYYRCASPTPQGPQTPLAHLRHIQTPQTLRLNQNGSWQSPVAPKPKFLTPQTFNSCQTTTSKSFVDAFITPLKMKAKKTLRTKLLDKLYRSDKSKKNIENLCPGQQESVNELERILEYLGLEKYYDFFAINEVEPEMLPSFSDADLRSMGINDKKVRELILKRIQKKLGPVD